MAKMFPPTPFLDAGKHTVVPGEEDVFNRLRDLPGTEDWLVFHSVHENIPQYECNYEADFIILIPQRGILALEVKSHETLYINPNDVDDAAWREKSENGPRLRHVTPLDQACRAANKFNLMREKHQVYTHVYKTEGSKQKKPQPQRAYAAVLMCDYPENAVPLVNKTAQKHISNPREHYICGEELYAPDLKERLESFFDVPWRSGEDPSFTREVMDAIEHDVHASIRFIKDPGIYNRNLETVTQRFAHLLEMTEDSTAHLLVQGCAGSGKTCMLLYEVERLVEQARAATPPRPLRILVLCYNKHLRDYLAGKLPPSGGLQVIDVHTVEDLAYQELGTTADSTPYDQLPERMSAWMQSGNSIAEQDSYDHIFVDEVQDMSAIHRRFLERYERPPYTDANGRPRNGRHYYFADSNQSLYDRVTGKSARHELPHCAMNIVLSHNLRNSWQIAYFSTQALPQELPERLRPKALEGSHGPEVRVLDGGNVHERRQQLEALLQELLSEPAKGGAENKVRDVMGLNPRDIVVLSPHAESHAENSYINANTCGVTCRSIKKFKGLESLCVILTDAYPPCSPHRDKSQPLPAEYSRSMTFNDLYVAATRAKFALYIIPTAEGKAIYDTMLCEARTQQNTPTPTERE